MPSSPTTAARLLDLIQSHRITALIYVAVKLELAESLRQGPKALDELARTLDADKGALRRFLNALVTLDLLSLDGPDSYSLTEIGATLDADAPCSLRNWTIFEVEMLARNWAGMIDTIKSGKTAAELRGFASSFDMMAQSPQNVDIFNAAMVDLTRSVTPSIVDAYDFGRFTRLLDVGGGSGELLTHIAKACPNLQGFVFDLARCEASARAHLVGQHIDDRVTFISGDFFHAIPAVADAIVLKSVIHDWDDNRSEVILTNCRKALPGTGTILLIERIMPDPPRATEEDRAHALSDLNMLRGPGGQERTITEFRELLARSGFEFTAAHPAGRFCLIEGRALAG
ncbi:methyltransferase [Bradyrhizobium sp. CNPSo 4010]|uniref:Methyltransferase n=1 Tax=Bradyrhizobium agreste TaxID=2751811 RepID=A0ABS0PHZ3_9BRAD|nr:methyltransferase [Bradyrhizobium agreste]MBH5396823.1 methyltransferase [Bradyrhizobium agreste]